MTNQPIWFVIGKFVVVVRYNFCGVSPSFVLFLFLSLVRKFKRKLIKFFYMLWNFFSVLFWRSVWLGQVHQAGSASWPLRSPPHWSLYMCWMELRVMIFTKARGKNYYRRYIILSSHSKVTCSVSLLCFLFLLFRGFPVWLKYVPGIAFRTDNGPFKVGAFNFFLSSLNI